MPRAKPQLPNLLVIGAMKAGTTSLHHYLGRHPEIFMSREKELKYFVGGRYWQLGPDWYRGNFRTARPLRGESSPQYTMFPRFGDVSDRIADAVPDAKLVYLVRDPVDRLVAEYSHIAQRGTEPQSLEEAATDADSRYVAHSRYFMQLEQFLRRFPADRILVVDQHELRTRRRETLREVFGFLGVDPGFESPAFDRELNVQFGEIRRNRAGRASVRGLERTLGPNRAGRVRELLPATLKRPFARVVERESLPAKIRERLQELLAADAERLRAHTGKTFSSWCV